MVDRKLAEDIRKRHPQIDEDVFDYLIVLFDRGYRSTSIHRMLKQKFGEVRARTDRTVRTVIRELSGRSNEPWSLVGSDPAEARAVLPPLRAVISTTDGRTTYVTVAEAGWIHFLAEACDGIAPWDLYVLARRYALAEQREESSRRLDQRLAFEPWTDEGRAYADAVARGWIERAGEIVELTAAMRLEATLRATLTVTPPKGDNK